MTGLAEVYILYENADKTEGRGPMVIHSVWDNKQEAEGLVTLTANTIFDRLELRTYKVFSSRNEYKTHVTELLRKTGLGKLTVEERKALGL